MTKAFRGRNGAVEAVDAVRVQSRQGGDGNLVSEELPGTELTMRADLVLLAMGFLHPVREGMVAELGVALDAQGNVLADTTTYRTSEDKVFAAGDMRRGQSLVVWAMAEGRGCARAVDIYLSGESTLPA
jgi:glutamate synthase (NADPH/NADH) small chain